MSIEKTMEKYKRSLYMDTNAVIRLHNERPDLEARLTDRIESGAVILVPANEVLLHELSYRNDEQCWHGDLAEGIYRTLVRHAGPEWGASENPRRASVAQSVWIARRHCEMPNKIKQFIEPYLDGKELTDAEALAVGREGWYRFILAMRLRPICHRFAKDPSAFRGKRYGNDFRDWMHVCYARAARCILVLDKPLAGAIQDMRGALDVQVGWDPLITDWTSFEGYLADPYRYRLPTREICGP